MAIPRERFEQGLTYEQWLEVMTKNRDRFEENEKRLKIEQSDVKAFKDLPEPLNVAVIAEDWCGDVIANLPILGRLAKESGKLNLRVFLRDQNLDLMDQYLKEGQFRSIPVFVFLDKDFNELGVFTERPDAVTELRAQKRQEIFDKNPEFGPSNGSVENLPDDVRARLQGALAQMRDDTHDQANAEVVKELRQLAGV